MKLQTGEGDKQIDENFIYSTLHRYVGKNKIIKQ